MTPQQLARLSTLLDEALDLDEPARGQWLAGLAGEDLPLAPKLRELLVRHAHKETGELLEAGPALTAMGVPRSPAATAPALAEGDRVGPYRLIRLLGEGGMGEVWLAERADGALKRQVALKLPTPWLRRGVLLQRFERERDILASLEHPHIARLYDAGISDDGQPYLALEVVEGLPIDAWCRERGIGMRQRVQLMQQVAQAVAFAHGRLVLHRDLKPGNILVTAQGEVRLLDFGIAKLLEAGDANGTAPGADAGEITQWGGRAFTLSYAAPEQVSGAPVSTATDVWALGVLLYELTGGEHPFATPGRSRQAVEHALLHDDPPRPRGVPDDLATVTLKALKKPPAERYASAEALHDDLARWLAGEPVRAEPDRAGYRLRKFVGRHRLGVAAVAVVTLAVLGGAGLAVWQAGVAARQAHKAEEVTRFLLDLIKTTDPDKGGSRNTTTVQMLRDARPLIESRFARQPDLQVRMLSEVAYALLGLGEAAEAVPLFEAAIGHAERHLPHDDPAALRARIRLGEALITVSRVNDAKALLAEGLAGMRRIGNAGGEIDALRWTSRYHSLLRENDLAIAAAREAAEVARTRLGSDALRAVLTAESELLSALQVARQAGQLEPARRVFELREQLDPGRLTRLKIVAREAYGTALVAEGDPVEGVRLLRNALDEAKTLFDPRDRMVGYFAGRLMAGLVATGDVAGALEAARFARRSWDEAHAGRLHSDLAFGRSYEGGALMDVQRHGEAQALLLEAAELFEKTMGAHARTAALARANAAVAQARDGDTVRARTTLGAPPAHAAVVEDAAVLARLGLVRYLHGRADEAVPALRTALEFLHQRSIDRNLLAPMQVWLALALTDLGRADEAKRLTEQALAVYVPRQPKLSPAQAEAWEALARAELALGRAPQALAAAGKAAAYWQGFNHGAGPPASALARSAALLAQAQWRAGDRAAAALSLDRAKQGATALRTVPERRTLDEAVRLLQGP